MQQLLAGLAMMQLNRMSLRQKSQQLHQMEVKTPTPSLKMERTMMRFARWTQVRLPPVRAGLPRWR